MVNPNKVSQRGVVFVRNQEDLSLSDQKELCQLLGQLSGKPTCSGLHVDAQIDPNSAHLGDDVKIISSTKRTIRFDSSRLASKGWHSEYVVIYMIKWNWPCDHLGQYHVRTRAIGLRRS
jgi:hypothetical protein